MSMFGKKRCIFVFLILVFLVPGVFAADEDTILRLSSPTNAHAEDASGSNYDTLINYTEIFGDESSFANPHICTGDNLVLKLSSPTNAHGEVSTGIDYTTDVCYGDLECNFVTGGAACSAGTECVVKLSDTINGHLETCSGTNYPVSLCCTSAAAGPTIGIITDLYWTDNVGNRLADGDGDGEVDFFKYAGNKVQLVAETTLGGGEPVTFDIKERDLGFDDDIRLGLTTVTDSSGKAIFIWEIDSADITAGGNDDPSQFYFDTSITGDSGAGIILNVKDEVGGNIPPTAIIVTPVQGIYTSDEIFLFSHASFDVENDIQSIEWDFGDGSTSSSDVPSHSYSSPGKKDITLTVTDDRGAIDIDEVSITLVDVVVIGNVVIPIIDQPGNGDTIVGENVSWDGSGSFVVEISENPIFCKPGGNCPLGRSIRCLGGECPDRLGIYDINPDPKSLSFISNVTGSPPPSVVSATS